jgi:monoamine oxidase
MIGARRCPPSEVDVVVIGAGLAGLHAGWRLQLAGRSVCVLEARARVGGRTWSETLENGSTIERGGEFIAHHQQTIHTVCDELGLEIVPHGISFERRRTADLPAPTPEEHARVVERAHVRTAERLEREGEDFPLAESFEPPSSRSAIEETVIRRIETSLTVPITNVSARWYMGRGEGAYDPARRVRGGNQLVSEALAERLGDRVITSMPAQSVQQTANRVTVRSSGGREIQGAAAVVAVPLPLLRDLDFEPTLPPSIAKAMDRTLFGDTAKIHVPLAEDPRPDAIAVPAALWWCWASQVQAPGVSAAVLAGFAGGAETMSALEVANGVGAWEAQILELVPELPRHGESRLTHWGADPWAKGSYSSRAVGFESDDDAAWQSPWHRVVFAGEHTAGELASSMNGALASGRRAAEAILDLLASRAPGA